MQWTFKMLSHSVYRPLKYPVSQNSVVRQEAVKVLAHDRLKREMSKQTDKQFSN